MIVLPVEQRVEWNPVCKLVNLANENIECEEEHGECERQPHVMLHTGDTTAIPIKTVVASGQLRGRCRVAKSTPFEAPSGVQRRIGAIHLVELVHALQPPQTQGHAE